MFTSITIYLLSKEGLEANWISVTCVIISFIQDLGVIFFMARN